MKRLCKIQSLALASIFMFSASTVAVSSDWSGWARFGSHDNVDIYWKYMDNSCGSHIRWKAVNNSERDVWPSVNKKRYTCENGDVDSASDETIGSVNLSPGSSSSTQADTCLCNGRGGVISASVSIVIK